MSNSLPDLHSHLSQLTKPILDWLTKTSYTPDETTKISTKSTIESLLSTKSSVKDFSLACALLSSSRSSTHELLAWVPGNLSTAAETAISELSKAYNDAFPGDEKRNLMVELMPETAMLLSFAFSRFERMLNEMLSHLERQPRNKDRHIAWLKFVEPIFNAVGLVLLAHFRRIFPLFFKWMHVDDDETVLLVLKRIRTVIRLTWIRHSPYFERCKGLQFETAWDKHKNDPDLTTLALNLSRPPPTMKLETDVGAVAIQGH